MSERGWCQTSRCAETPSKSGCQGETKIVAWHSVYPFSHLLFMQSSKSKLIYFAFDAEQLVLLRIVLNYKKIKKSSIYIYFFHIYFRIQCSLF